MLLNAHAIDKSVAALLQDSILCTSFETLRELVVLFNNKKIRSKQWKTAEDILHTIVDDMNIEILHLREDVAFTYSRLQLNESMNHYDPSDHIIISQAITEHLPLISSDLKFPFYREQGLELIEC
jgi:PIN domain nuclease of toxin-antitoxin system